MNKLTKHRKKVCRYCETDKVCLTCSNIIKCSIITNCISCGGIYGRPLFTPISAGCILLEYPYITIIFETDKDDKLKGTLNDIGGKFDPDLDKNIIDTVLRETKEETGNLLCMDGSEPYVDIAQNKHNVTYRCYLIDSSIKKRYVNTSIVPENPVVKMKIEHFLTIPKQILEPRLGAILKSTLIYPGHESPKPPLPVNMIEYMIMLNRTNSNIGISY